MDIESDRVAVLLSLLEPEPARPSTVDIKRIVVDGQRRKRVRTVAGRTAVAVLAGALIGSGVGVAAARAPQPAPFLIGRLPGPSATQLVQQPPPPSGCVVHVLPVPDGLRDAEVIAMDPTGHYLVGRSVDGAGRYHPLLWTGEVPTVLDRRGVDGIDGIAVNQAGMVAWSGSNQAQRGTWRYRDGVVNPVAVAAGYRVMAIDQSGGIYAVDQGADPGPAWHLRLLAVSADGQSTVRDLQAADPAGHGLVLAVDTDGTAVGVADSGKLPLANGRTQAAIWPPDGGMRLLSLPAGFAAAVAATVAGGRIGGTAWHPPASRSDPTGGPDPAGQPVVVAWDDGAAPPRPPVMLSQIFAINRYGWLVGADQDRVPVLVAGDQVLRLPVPAGTRMISMVTAISMDGRVIAGHLTQGGTVVPLRWSCA